MNAADRRWLLAQLRKLRDDIQNDIRVELNETIRAEAQSVVLRQMTQGQRRETQ